jgi:hypothetical protein
MNTRYRPILTITTVHEYYGGPCADLGFLVPSDTGSLLRGGRMLSRVLDGRLHLLVEADDQGDPVIPFDGLVLRFGLQLVNDNFGNFTAPGPGLDGTTARYRNDAAPAALDPPLPVTLTGRVLAHQLQGAGRPVTVIALDRDGEEARKQVVTAAMNADAVSLMFDDMAPGPLTLEEQFPAGVTKTTAYYLDPELRALGVFGVVELELDEGFLAAPPDFQLGFAARQESLRYYVVARNYSVADFGDLSVKDAGFAEDARPKVVFDKVLPAAFTPAELPPEALGGAGEPTVLFRSQNPVPRRAAGRHKLQLNHNGDVLIAHLPQPGAARPTADLIIHLAKP